mmetsp:Transcript_5250/g.13715  ORF Transcript_5250/g.13715 Transcript_5250/m.13715 type:complete len:182 (-) Transcript_5250:21-566(-)
MLRVAWRGCRGVATRGLVGGAVALSGMEWSRGEKAMDAWQARNGFTQRFTGMSGDGGVKNQDAILLKGLTFFGRHGVRPEEVALGQKFVVDLKIYTNLLVAGETDCLTETVDYSQVYQIVKKIVEGKHRHLIESVAHGIASAILHQHSSVESVSVCVKKPQVSLMGPLDFSGIEIHRHRTR